MSKNIFKQVQFLQHIWESVHPLINISQYLFGTCVHLLLLCLGAFVRVLYVCMCVCAVVCVCVCKGKKQKETSLAPSQQIEFSRALHRSHRHMIIVVVFIGQISKVTSVFDADQPELLRCWGVNATGANLKVAQGHCGPGRYYRSVPQVTEPGF